MHTAFIHHRMYRTGSHSPYLDSAESTYTLTLRQTHLISSAGFTSSTLKLGLILPDMMMNESLFNTRPPPGQGGLCGPAWHRCQRMRASARVPAESGAGGGGLGRGVGLNARGGALCMHLKATLQQRYIMQVLYCRSADEDTVAAPTRARGLLGRRGSVRPRRGSAGRSPKVIIGEGGAGGRTSVDSTLTWRHSGVWGEDGEVMMRT